MRKISSFTFLGLTALVVNADLKVYSNEALQQAVQQGDPIMVTFSHIQCDNTCDNMISILDKLSNEMNEISFSNIRGDLDPGILDDLQIREFPTTIMFHHGHPEIYEDKNNINEESVKSFIDNILSRKTVKYIDNNQSKINEIINQVLEQDERILFIAELKNKDSETASIYEEVTSGIRSLAEYYAFINPKINKEIIRVYRPLEGIIEEPKGSKSVGSKSVGYKSVASLSKITPGRLSRFIRSELVPAFGNPRPPVYYLSRQVVYYAGTEQDIQNVTPILEKVGRKSRPEVTIVSVPLPKLDEFAKNYLGMPGPFPQMMAHFEDSSFVRRYIFDGVMEVSSVEDFILDARERRLKRYFRSEEEEEIDENQNSSRPKNVRKLVNKNIKQIIKRHEKHHFFTLVHADWCSHCGPALEAFYKLAEEYIDNHHVMFGTFEASRNDPPSREFSTPQYPAIFHSAPGTGISMDYRMEINYDTLIDLVEESLEGERLMIEDKLRKHHDDEDDDDDDDDNHDNEIINNLQEANAKINDIHHNNSQINFHNEL